MGHTRDLVRGCVSGWFRPGATTLPAAKVPFFSTRICKIYGSAGFAVDCGYQPGGPGRDATVRGELDCGEAGGNFPPAAVVHRIGDPSRTIEMTFEHGAVDHRVCTLLIRNAQLWGGQGGRAGQGI
jgi:hypothetical protein